MHNTCHITCGFLAHHVLQIALCIAQYEDDFGSVAKQWQFDPQNLHLFSDQNETLWNLFLWRRVPALQISVQTATVRPRKTTQWVAEIHRLIFFWSSSSGNYRIPCETVEMAFSPFIHMSNASFSSNKSRSWRLNFIALYLRFEVLSNCIWIYSHMWTMTTLTNHRKTNEQRGAGSSKLNRIWHPHKIWTRFSWVFKV